MISRRLGVCSNTCRKALSNSIIIRRCVTSSDEVKGTEEPGKPIRIERLLANLGYGVREEAKDLVKRGRVKRKDGKKLKVGEKVLHSEILLDDEELDKPSPIAILLHKPVGYVVTSPDDERIPDPKVYDLLPQRFGQRDPFLACVGRLDKATSGLLILSDVGQLVQRINNPKKGIWKTYQVTLSSSLSGQEAEKAIKKFASGTMVLPGDNSQDPLLPARLEIDAEDPHKATVIIQEGRYHQIRRMFSSIGIDVVKLHRSSSGGLPLGDLPCGEWKYLTQEEIQLIFSGPTAEEVIHAAATA